MNKPNPSAGGRYVLSEEGEHVKADAKPAADAGAIASKPRGPFKPATKANKPTRGVKHGAA